MYNFDHLTSIIDAIDIDQLLTGFVLAHDGDFTIFGNEKAWNKVIIPKMLEAKSLDINNDYSCLYNSKGTGWPCKFVIDNVEYQGYGWNCWGNEFIPWLLKQQNIPEGKY